MQGQGYAAGMAEGAGGGLSVAVWGRSISPFSHSSDFWGGVGMAHPTHLAMAATGRSDLAFSLIRQRDTMAATAAAIGGGWLPHILE
jgi:hypothetical protein